MNSSIVMFTRYWFHPIISQIILYCYRPFAEQILEDCYVDARKIASRRSQLPIDVFPAQPIATLEQLLDEDWFCND